MSKDRTNFLNYATYRTFSILPEESVREYTKIAWSETTDELYEKVKQKIMELPIAEAEKQMKQVELLFQNILEGKPVTLETERNASVAGKVTENVNVETKKKTVAATLKEKVKNEANNEANKEEKTIQRPRLKLTGTCSKCQEKTYLQFTDGYFCPSCNSIHVDGVMDSKKRNLQERMRTVLFDCGSNPQKTINEVNSMLKTDPNSAQLYGRLGLAYRQLNDYQTAMEYYQKAVELDDRDGIFYSNMGVVYILQGNYMQASKAFEKGLKCWREGNYSDWSPEVMFANYSIALQKTGNFENAFSYLCEAYQMGYKNCENLVKNWGVGKEYCAGKVAQLIDNPSTPYSTNLKKDDATMRKVKRHFSITSENEVYYFWDYTVFGGCKEGVAICADGIYFRMLSSKINVIKWYELKSYEFQMSGKDIIARKQGEKNNLPTMYFLQKPDGNNFYQALLELQLLL